MGEDGGVNDSKLAITRPRGAVRGAQRWLIVARHYVSTSLRTRSWWITVAVALIQIGCVAWPLVKLGWRQAIVSGGILLAMQLFKKFRENSPKNMQVVERNYLDRKLRLYELVHQLQQRELMTPPEVARFQRKALELIAAYVRDHRRDQARPTIFANLLAEEGDELVVIARDRDHRAGHARYAKKDMLAGTVIAEGIPVVTGDLYGEYPGTPPGKAYKSILVIPVYRDGEVVGAVSIDSSRRYHFDLDASNLVEYLMPYVALLAWTLRKSEKNLRLPIGVSA